MHAKAWDRDESLAAFQDNAAAWTQADQCTYTTGTRIHTLQMRQQKLQPDVVTDALGFSACEKGLCGREGLADRVLTQV